MRGREQTMLRTTPGARRHLAALTLALTCAACSDATPHRAESTGDTDDAGSEMRNDPPALRRDGGASDGSFGLDANRDTDGTADETNTEPADASSPDASAPARDEWVSYGRDLAHTRDNPAETALTPSTVPKLKRAWTWDTAAVTSTPSYYDGKLYFGDWLGYVVALDAKTGDQLWRTLLPNQAVKQVTASTSVDEQSVYVGSDISVYRLDRQTGAVEWSQAVARKDTSAHVYSSPAIAGGVVITGVASFQNVNPIADGFMLPPFRGTVVALDQATGAVRWTITLTTGKGVGVTSSASIDVERGRLYIGSGQNYDDTDSPYADSLLALDLQTGKHVWHAQFTKNDVYSLYHLDGPDHDVLAVPLLFRDGELEGVAVGDKGGSYFAYDREGTLLWAKKLTPGGHHGGVMGSAAYHGGVIYVCSGDFSTDMTLGIGQDAPAASLLIALRARDGTELWSTPLKGACYGSVSHAGGVVFLPMVSGHVRAFAADSGAEIWSDELPQSSAAGVTISNGMMFVPFGWDWLNTAAPGGIAAYGLH
jgi:polyvinyl alcohol dehydrogenase (cytochrome)